MNRATAETLGVRPKHRWGYVRTLDASLIPVAGLELEGDVDEERCSRCGVGRFARHGASHWTYVLASGRIYALRVARADGRSKPLSPPCLVVQDVVDGVLK